jgi:pimeloyl-ACP methyl ester carboxylesterase
LLTTQVLVLSIEAEIQKLSTGGEMSKLLGILIAAGLIHQGLASAGDYGHDDDNDRILGVQHYVPHVSNVPANAGENVELFVWERIKAGVAKEIATGKRKVQVVLFVHGGSNPSVPAFDLDHESYSWMKSLAEAGFDVFSMDRQGYGFSPRPMMDDPCNTNPAQQNLLVPFPLSAPCSVAYKFRLSSSRSDWNELNTVVDYLRDLRGVDKISIAGWSAAGPLAGGWVVNNQDKVDKLIFHAANYVKASPINPPAAFPVPGFPMTLRTKDEFLTEWGAEVACEDQVDPAVQDVVWQKIMDFDRLGATWGASGVMRIRTGNNWGWNSTTVPTVTVPMLYVIGQNDGLLGQGRDLYAAIGSQNKVMVEVECASHSLNWETRHEILHRASKHFLRHNSFEGVTQGVLTVHADGTITRQ